MGLWMRIRHLWISRAATLLSMSTLSTSVLDRRKFWLVVMTFSGYSLEWNVRVDLIVLDGFYDWNVVFLWCGITVHVLLFQKWISRLSKTLGRGSHDKNTLITDVLLDYTHWAEPHCCIILTPAIMLFSLISLCLIVLNRGVRTRLHTVQAHDRL
jgi:hypothetical protein